MYYKWFLILIFSFFIKCDILNNYSKKEPVVINPTITSITNGEWTRMIWLEDTKSRTWGGLLVGYDTKTGIKDTILPFHSRYFRPALCYGGNAIAFSINFQTFITDWSGSKPRFICNGRIQDVWKDPQTGFEWVIVHDIPIETDSGFVVRYRIDDPTKFDTLFSDYPLTCKNDIWYRVSLDGSYSLAFLPWNKAFFMQTSTENLVVKNKNRVSEGCWISVAKSNEGYWVHLSGNHRSFVLFNKDKEIKYLTPPDECKPIHANEVYSPRFASKGSHVLLFTVGYYINHESDSAEVIMAKMSDDYTEFEEWVALTDDSIAQSSPDAWVGVDPNCKVLLPPIKDVDISDSSLSTSKWIHITSPTDSTLLSKNAQMTVTWESSKNIAGVVVWASANNGINWKKLTDNVIVSGSDEMWGSWTIDCQDVLDKLELEASHIQLKLSAYSDVNICSKTGTFLINEYLNK